MDPIKLIGADQMMCAFDVRQLKDAVEDGEIHPISLLKITGNLLMVLNYGGDFDEKERRVIEKAYSLLSAIETKRTINRLLND